MPLNSVKVGNFYIHSVSDGYMIFQRDAFFPNLPIESWKPYPSYSDPKFEMNIGSFVIEGADKTILVDTGLGKLNHHIEQPMRETLLSELEAFSIKPTDIDIVFLTHLHLDHVGTNMTRDNGVWKQTYPKAQYMVGKSDWEMFSRMINNPSFKYLEEQVQPLLSNGSLYLFEGEIPLTEGVVTIPTPGHTPGHTSLLIESDGAKAVIMGDTVHIPPQVEQISWSPDPDRDKALSAETRSDLMDFIEKEHALIISGHFPKPGFGEIIQVGSTRSYRPIT